MEAERSAEQLRPDYGESGRLVVVHPDGTTSRLLESFHSVADPDVSFDGQRLLVAGKQAARDNVEYL